MTGNKRIRIIKKIKGGVKKHNLKMKVKGGVKKLNLKIKAGLKEERARFIALSETHSAARVIQRVWRELCEVKARVIQRVWRELCEVKSINKKNNKKKTYKKKTIKVNNFQKEFSEKIPEDIKDKYVFKKRHYLNMTDGVIKNIHKDFKNKTDVRPNIDFIKDFIVSKYGLVICEENRVSVVHMGMKTTGGGIKLRKGIGSDTAGQGRPFIIQGIIVAAGNKCCAVLLDDPDTYDEQDTTQFKYMKTAYNKGRGMIKKVVYEESVIKYNTGNEEEEINEELIERGWVL